MPPHICLNMIVRNESARIIRALDSCKDYISSFAILDTGSFDATTALIREWGITNGIPGIVGQGFFINFSQARNQALGLARSWHTHPDAPAFDYLLLMDADMELRLDHPAAFDDLQLDVYEMLQRAGGMSYNNIRLISAADRGTYVGVTHEFYNSPAQGFLAAGAYFVDHADGANRIDKFGRDIRLLRDDLANDPENPRTWFYLANSYRDAGQFNLAADAYRKRIALGGWDEEVWQAQVFLAEVLLKQGLEDAFLKEIMAAYQLRPQRLEPLHMLGKHLREKGHQRTALLFIKQGLHADRPGDKLFIQDWVYDWGFREEYSICAFYDPAHRDLGYRVTNNLAIDKHVPEHVRQLARSNMAFYLPRLDTFCPSFHATEINFLCNRGMTAMNPSVCSKPNGGLEVLLRTVNYRIDHEGRYMIGPKECNDAPIETENWLLQLDDDLTTRDYYAVIWDRPAPKFPQVLGLEDMRIWWRAGIRHFSATVREQSATGQCEMWTGKLRALFGTPRNARVEEAHRISDGVATEKNWVPVLGLAEQKFMYNTRTVYNAARDLFEERPWSLMLENVRGSSQLIPFKSGFLAVVHEAIYRDGKRVYQHRFVHYDCDLNLTRLSLPFVFEDIQIEFCAGLALHPEGKSLVVSYGVRDEKAMLARINIEEVAFFVGALS